MKDNKAKEVATSIKQAILNVLGDVEVNDDDPLAWSQTGSNVGQIAYLTEIVMTEGNDVCANGPSSSANR